MGVLAVQPGAVAAAARVLQALARDLDAPAAPPAVGGRLQAALSEFADAWTRDAERLAELARAAAAAAAQADDRYQQLERLLIPAALR